MFSPWWCGLQAASQEKKSCARVSWYCSMVCIGSQQSSHWRQIYMNPNSYRRQLLVVCFVLPLGKEMAEGSCMLSAWPTVKTIWGQGKNNSCRDGYTFDITSYGLIPEGEMFGLCWHLAVTSMFPFGLSIIIQDYFVRLQCRYEHWRVLSACMTAKASFQEPKLIEWIDIWLSIVTC